MHAHRMERVAEALREEVEEIINYELSDPRIGAVAVTQVLLAPGGRRARILVAPAGETEEQLLCLAALGGARRHVRALLAGRLEMFRIPDLDFEADFSAGAALRLPRLLRRMRKGRPRDQEREKGNR